MDLTNIPLSMIIIAIVIMTLNVLDSVTTNLCFRQYPDKELKGEANPFMRKIMLKNHMFAEVIKQVGVLGLVIYFLSIKDILTLRYFALILGLVVLNNSYVLISRAITKRKVVSPAENLRILFHIPNKLIYFVAIAIICGIAYAINTLIW